MKLPDWLIRNLIARVTRRHYDLTVGPEDNPTYYRWHIIPRNPVFNLYLHYFVNDDDDRALHDHRYVNVSLPLVGTYKEVVFRWKPKEGWALPLTRTVYRPNQRLVVRLPSTAHRIELWKDEHGNPRPCWSLFICLPRWQDWGFFCTDEAGGCRRVPWQKYSDPGNYGKIGRGCEE